MKTSYDIIYTRLNDLIKDKYGDCRWKVMLTKNIILDKSTKEWEVAIYQQHKKHPVLCSGHDLDKLMYNLCLMR